MSDERQLEGYSQIVSKLASRGYYGPTNLIPGWETIAIGAKVATGGKAAYEVSRSVKEAMDSKHPLLVSILHTRTTDDGHELIMDISNLSVHGLHLEKISLKDPEYPEIEVKNHMDSESPYDLYSETVSTHLGKTETDKTYTTNTNALPAYLPLGEKIRIRVKFPLFDDFRMKNRDHGKLSIQYVLAGGMKGRQEKLEVFSVRQQD